MASVTKPTKDERVDLRLPLNIKRQLEQAAALVGQSVSAFILGHVVPQAQKVIREASMIELSDRDSRRFLSALDDDAAVPNEPMRRAAERYKSEVA